MFTNSFIDEQLIKTREFMDSLDAMLPCGHPQEHQCTNYRIQLENKLVYLYTYGRIQDGKINHKSTWSARLTHHEPPHNYGFCFSHRVENNPFSKDMRHIYGMLHWSGPKDIQQAEEWVSQGKTEGWEWTTHT